MVSSKKEEFCDMELKIKLRIMNGAGDTVRGSIKSSLFKELEKNSGGAIKVLSKSIREDMPNDGWTGFDWYGTLNFRLNLTKAIKDAAGFMTSVVKTFVGKGFMASQVEKEVAKAIKETIEKKENELLGPLAAVFWGSASCEGVWVTPITDVYYG